MSKTILTVAHLAHRWGVSTNLVYKRLYRMRQDYQASYRYDYVRYHGPAGVTTGVTRGVHPPQMPVWHRDAQSRRIWFETETVITWEKTEYGRAWLARQTDTPVSNRVV